MENLKDKIEELLNTKILKIEVWKADDNINDEYTYKIMFHGNINEMRSLFDYNDNEQ
jgi:hypothetical protein